MGSNLVHQRLLPPIAEPDFPSAISYQLQMRSRFGLVSILYPGCSTFDFTKIEIQTTL